MTRANGKNGHQPPSSTRCAVYCRVSTDENLGMEFNSLHAQREAGEAFILSRKMDGWICLPDDYSDGGFSGSTLDRPAMLRLLANADAGLIDCIVVYRLDRFSRSLSDFVRVIDRLRAHNVAFVSVTESFSTDNAVGRLTMGLLATFAEFERATIAQRTSDKMRAARRRGLWTGGRPVLGFDLPPGGKKLVVNEDEAAMVRTIYDLYLQKKAITAVVDEVDRRGWVNKIHTTRAGKRMGGGSFTKNAVHFILTNPLYAGEVRYLGEHFAGEHEAIVSAATFQRVQDQLAENARSNGAHMRDRYGFLLRGLVRCVACDAAYVPSVSRRGSRVYRYLVCSSAMKKGYRTCPCPSISAQKLEDVIVQQIRVIGQDRELQRATLAQVRSSRDAKRPALGSEQRRLRKRLEKVRGDIRSLLDALAVGERGASVGARIAELEAEAEKLDRRLTEIAQELAALDADAVDEADLAKALSLFTPIWDVLFPVEQARIIQLLIERIEHDARTGTLAVEFAPSGIQALAGEVDSAKESACASS